MAKRIKGAVGLSDAIMSELKEYTDVTCEDMKETGKQVAKEGANKLKRNSPEKSGKYAKNWRIATDKIKRGSSAVIYNKKKPGLTHLLEKGHALKNGGRTKPVEHIKPIEEWCNEEFEKRLKQRIEK